MKRFNIFVLLVLALATVFVLSACGEETDPAHSEWIEPCEDDRHEFSVWKTEKEAVCNENGSQIRTCLICGLSQRQTVINTTNHDYVNYVCTRCGDSVAPTDINYILSDDETYYILNTIDVMDVAEYTVPTEYNGLPVKEIAPKAFKDCTKLETVVIPNTVEKIGEGAFMGCYKLKKLTIPFVGMNKTEENAVLGYIFGNPSDNDGLVGIEQTVNGVKKEYWISQNLTNVTVTGGELYAGCFENCSMLKRVEYTGEGTKVHDNAFDGCKALDQVSLPLTVIEYGNRAFQNCYELDTFPITEGVEKIGDYCFAGCNTDYLALPSTLKTVGESAFAECNFIKTVIIPSNIERLSNYMFQNCSALESVTLMEPTGIYEIKSIGRYCFAGCESLKTVVIASTVEEIRNLAFYDCTSLISVNIPSSTKEIKDKAFKGCISLTEVTIENGIEKICKEAFESCVSLKSLSFPSSLKEIEADAFKNCSSLTSFEINPANTNFASENGHIFSAGKSKLILVAPGYSEETLTIPEGVTSIEEGAFANATSVNSVVFPSTLKSIAQNAFYQHPSIKSITISGSLQEIGTLAFAGCPLLESVTVSGVDTIGESAFTQCPELKTVVVDKVTSISKGAFYSCAKLESLTLSNVGLVGENAFAECKSLSTVDISNNVTDIGKEAFTLCESLESVTIGSGTASLGEFAFSSCTKLKNITIEEGLATIGEACFENCTALEEIALPASLSSINAYAFKSCTALAKMSVSRDNPKYAVTRSIYLLEVDNESGERALIIVAPAMITEEMTLPENITSIGSYVFRHAQNLQKVNLPESLRVIGREAFFDSGLTEIDLKNVEEIGEYAFGETMLTEVKIPEAVKTIKRYAFQYCYELKSIYIGTNVEEIGFGVFNNVGTEESPLNIYVGFEESDIPDSWNENWLKTAVCNVTYGYTE